MTYIELLEKDLSFGNNQENLLLDLLKTYFNTNIIKSNIKNSWYDYYCENNYYELKSRKFNLNKYPTTMIGANKIMKASEVKADVYFIFNFVDKVGYIKYDPILFNTFEIKNGGRFDRGRIELNKYYYIPVKHLIIM